MDLSACERFRALHGPGRFLVLPNAWDAASARLVEEAGADAIATSSAAVAWSHGYADGEALPTAIVLAAVAEIVRVVKIPVSVDSEAGYSADPGQVADHASALIDLGVAGINLEDGPHAPDLTARKIEAIKAAAHRKGADLFVNARADVFLKKLTDPQHAREEMIRRGLLYRSAGADGFFAPAVTDTADMRAIADGVGLPLNILFFPGVPSFDAMREAGVRRVSAGAGISRVALGAARTAIRAYLEGTDYGSLFAPAKDLPNMNALLSAVAPSCVKPCIAPP
jgi:2-methylisocitrate lyase-like PEP mutase family enzyme